MALFPRAGIANLPPLRSVYSAISNAQRAHKQAGLEMFNLKNGFTRRALLLLLPLALLTTSTGCIRQMAQLLYVIKGHEVPADYDGLAESKIAVVCVSDASAYGPDTLTYSIAKNVSVKLSQGLKKTEIISPAKIENWIDQNGWDPVDAATLGEDLGADKVLVIEIGAYSIHDGATLHKGTADLTCTVYDVEKDGQVSYVHGPDVYTFPTNGRPSLQTSDRQFEAVYLARLTDRITRLFVVTDKLDTVADDAIFSK